MNPGEHVALFGDDRAGVLPGCSSWRIFVMFRVADVAPVLEQLKNRIERAAKSVVGFGDLLFKPGDFPIGLRGFLCCAQCWFQAGHVVHWVRAQGLSEGR